MMHSNLSGISLRDVEYVVAVAELGSFIKAAKRCNVSQPSLSMQVAKLEARLDVMIFERTSRRFIITKRGERVVEQMRRVLTEARALLALSGTSTTPFGGTLVLSAIATLGPYYFPHILPGLRSHYRDVGFILGEGRTDELVELLLHGELDAVLMSGPVTASGLAALPLFREPFVMICPEGHSAVGNSADSWVGLHPTERLLLTEGHCLRSQALAACADSGAGSRHATGLETLKYMVAAGEGCTLLPALALNALHGIECRALPGPGYSREIELVWRRSDRRAAEFDQLGRYLRGLPHPNIEMITSA